MNFIKKTRDCIANMNIPAAMMLSALIVGLSIFITTWVFFGGDNNRQRLSVKNPAFNKDTKTQQPASLTPEQIKQIQEQRAKQMAQPVPQVAPKSE